MKRILPLLSLLPLALSAQTATENYVRTTTYKKPTSQVAVDPGNPAHAAIEVTYLDGLGRPIQQLSHKQSATGRDIVTHIEYDSLGRQPREYLPFIPTGGASLEIKNNETLSFYGSNNQALSGNAYFATTGSPYSEKLFEGSPLGRVIRQGAPGSPWALNPSGSDHSIKTDYHSNTAGEVRKFGVTSIWDAVQGLYVPTLTSHGFYPAQQLYKTITKDENWTAGSSNTTQEFRDMQGRTVLKRSFNGQEPHDTYYVYDDYGSLCFVIPPLADASAITASVLDGSCYQYRYDHRSRLVEKKLPGKQWEFMVYDQLDRLVCTGPSPDPFAGPAQGWLFTRYDALNRVCYTGWYKDAFTANTRRNLQQGYNTAVAVSATRTNSTIDGVSVNYSNAGIPTGLKLLTVNYYDNYAYPNGPSLPGAVEGQEVLTGVRGLATGNWVRVLLNSDTTAGETSWTLYDKKARPIRTYKRYHNTGDTTTDTRLDFQGKALYSITRHRQAAGGPELVTREDFTYSPQDRLLVHTHTINGGAPQLIAHNRYDALGQLIGKEVGGTDTETLTGLQRVDYRYNIRGWLTHINDVSGLQQPLQAGDLFAFKISYDTPEDGLNGEVQPLFDGNISETSWRVGTDNTLRRYGYAYDGLNRLRHALYQKPENNLPLTHSYDEQVGYDRNGNITRLLRNGDSDSDDVNFTLQIDDLRYEYDPLNPNRLLNVSDVSGSPQGFKDVTGQMGDYGYDANGNMVRDVNKGITNITYNHLNLPVSITFGSAGIINYFYNAAGRKVSKQVVAANGSTTTTDYMDGYQYTDGILGFFPHGEGYVNVAYCETCAIGQQYGYSYVYNYTDHLGNIRVSYGLDPQTNVLKILEQNHYYPFGLKHTNYNSDTKTYSKSQQQPQLKIKAVPVGVTMPYKYKYNGKELQDELGLNVYDYGARNYDPATGRWFNVDNMAEKFHDTNPYAYVNNNPIINVDLDGNEWFYHSVKGGDPTWNWHEGNTYNTGVKDDNGKEVVLTGVEAVVQFNGSRNEKLGTKNGKEGFIDGDGAVDASVTVYGPDGPNDVHTYKGYTMGSDPKKFGFIDEGMYDGNYDAVGKSGSLKSNWAVNARGRIRMADGSLNPYAPSQIDGQYEGYKTGIFIHTSNKNGFAGTINGGKSGISVGCLLISPSDWKNFNDVMSGVKNFKVQVIRTQNMSVPIQGRNGVVPNARAQRKTTKFD